MPDFFFSPLEKRKKTGDPKIIEVKDAILGRNRIIFIGHAQERLTDWGLDYEDALKVLRDPDDTNGKTADGRKRYRRNKTDRVAVDVVFEEFPEDIVVITVIKIPRRMIKRGTT